MSNSSTPIPSAANAPARLMARVVLPEPPFWLQTAITVMPDAPTQLAMIMQTCNGSNIAPIPSAFYDLGQLDWRHLAAPHDLYCTAITATQGTLAKVAEILHTCNSRNIEPLAGSLL